MAHGMHIATKAKRRLWPAWLLIAVIVLAASFGGVAAYLSTTAGPVTNEFDIAGEQDPTVEGYVVSVPADLGYSVYVRAAVIVNWKAENGDVLAQAPVQGADYSITMNETDWFEYRGFWYCRAAVAPGGSTATLIGDLTVATEQSGYTLTAELAAQTIQALGSTDVADPYSDGTPAVTEAWKVLVSDGKLTAPTA